MRAIASQGWCHTLNMSPTHWLNPMIWWVQPIHRAHFLNLNITPLQRHVNGRVLMSTPQGEKRSCVWILMGVCYFALGRSRQCVWPYLSGFIAFRVSSLMVCWWRLVHSGLKWVTKLSKKKFRPCPHMGKWTIASGFTLFGSVHTDEVRDFFLALFTLFCFFYAVRVRVLLKWFLS